MDLILWLKRCGQVRCLFFIHKDSDVRSDRVLFRDDAKPDAGDTVDPELTSTSSRERGRLPLTSPCLAV